MKRRTRSRSVLALALGWLGFACEIAAQEVTLPLDAYESLRERARPTPAPAPGPPVPFTIETASIEVHPAFGSARVVQKWSLLLYARDWQQIPLPDAGSVTSVALGTLEGRVIDDDGRTLVVRGPGRHDVTIESVVPMVEDEASARPSRALRFTLPRAGIVTGLVDVTAVVSPPIEEVLLTSGGIARGTLAGGRFEFVGAPGANLDVRLLGARRAPERSSLPLRFDASSATLLRLGRTRADVRAFLEADVLQGRLEALRLRVPSGYTVVRVEAGESGWRLDGPILVVTPPTPIEDHFSAVAVLQGASVTDVAAPLLSPEGASRATLTSGLSVDADGIPVVTDPGSARGIDENELAALPRAFQDASVQVLRVRDAAAPPRWSVEWSDSGQQKVLAAQVDRLVIDALVGSAGRTAYQCWAFVRSTGASALTVQMPPGFELARAERNDLVLTPGANPEGLEIPLGGGTDTQRIFLTGVLPFDPWSDDDKETELALPLPSLSAPIGRIEVRVALPGEREYTLDTGLDPRYRGPFDLPETLTVPQGFTEIAGSWTALTSAPGSLRIHARTLDRKRKWF